MNRTADDDAPSLWSEQWAIQASVEADSIEHRMRVSLTSEAVDERRKAAAHGIEDLLHSAREATRRRTRWRWRGPFDRWRGTSVERAYQSLHAARILLVHLLPSEDVSALVPSVVARAETMLKPDDPRRTQIDQLPRMESGPAKRAALRQAMEITYDASDQLHMRVRAFRNILIAAAALIALLMIVLVVVVQAHPKAMPLCFTPTATAAPAQPASATASLDTQPTPALQAPQTQPAASVCPSGDRQAPSSGDVIIVAGLGLLGGALAAAFAIRKIRGSSTPYDVPIALAFLKVPSGSLTAVAGMLLLGGGFVPGLSELDSQRQILAYALLFGYAQQLGTRLIDSRAQSILNSLPSKDPEAKQPAPTRQPVTTAQAPVLQPVNPSETSIDSSSAS